MSITLSKSTLEEYRRCARCFWLIKHEGLRTPQGIRAGVPMGIDRVLKKHYDDHRKEGKVPEELAIALPGWSLYHDQEKLRKMRYWKSGLRAGIEGFEIYTALDELLFNKSEGLYMMADYKSKAKKTDTTDTYRYYSVQAGCYDWALNANGFPTCGESVFLYYRPIDVKPQMVASAVSGIAPMTWGFQAITIKADPEMAKCLLREAGSCLSRPIPDPGPDCELCGYLTKRFETVEKIKSLQKA